MQKTDRQQEELVSHAELNQFNFNRNLDVYVDVISGFKDGEMRPNFSILKTKVEMGEYRQVLFSEFSRLDRKPSNLLRDLEWFQGHDCWLFFNKQNLWVRGKNDIGTQIMIQVLAVMSQYEIELFTSRGVNGKISAIKNRNTYKGGPYPYGYSLTADKKLVVNDAEASVVRRIFDMYLHGAKTVTIADALNAEKIPCSYKSRIKIVNERRKNRGLSPANYVRGDIHDMIWRPTTVARIARNKVYIGIQKHIFHEPDPANPLPREKRESRRVIDEFEVLTPETRLVSDEVFYAVNRTFEERMFNRNQAIKRPTMLKDLLRCGECGNRFCVVNKSVGRSYQCAGRVGRSKTKCSTGSCVQMTKLDGLVLVLCLQKFARYDLLKKSETKIKELETTIAERSKSYDEYVVCQKEATETYSRQVQLAVKYAASESEADAMIRDAKAEYEKKTSEYSESLGRLKNELSELNRRRRSLLEIKDEGKMMSKMDEIMADQQRVKEYIHDYVMQVTLYKPDPLWILVSVTFLDGSERWGTIKSEKYRKSELGQRELFAGRTYSGWQINNDSHKFTYDCKERMFTEVKYGRVVGRYDFGQFDNLVHDRKMLGTFSPYDFDVKE